MTLFAGWLLLSALITIGIFGLIFNYCAGKLNKEWDEKAEKYSRREN